MPYLFSPTTVSEDEALVMKHISKTTIGPVHTEVVQLI